MNGTRKLTLGMRALSLVLLGGLFAVGGLADDGTAPPLGDALRAELSVIRPVYSPERPIWLRFTLHNTSDEPVSIPLRGAFDEAEGVALPAELAFGLADSPCLTLAQGDQRPKDVLPPAPSSPTGPGVRVLRLAPHGSVGAEFDLREVHQNVRYPGQYSCEWRPLDGQVPAATVSFRVEPRKDAILVTDHGKVTFVLDYDQAPKNVANFIELVADGFYNGTTFYRVVPGALLIGGSPNGDPKAMRPDGKLIPAEFNDTRFELGTLAMARKPNDPGSASCQFFIALTRLEELDGQYTIIGQARDEESLRTLQQMSQVKVDAQGHPVTDIVVRSINLIDTETDRVRHLGLRAIQPAPTPASAESADTPR